MDAIDALTRRVSGGQLVEPAPDELELHSMLAAAARAPDHGRLRPWRFVILRGAARKRLGAIMGRAYHRRHPDATPAQIDKEVSKPLRAPLVVVVAATINEESHIPAIEQVLSAAAAAQNIMVAAFALGYGCAWKTGDAAYDSEVKGALGLAAADAIVGFMYLGTNLNTPPAVEPVDLSQYVVEWPDDAP